MTDNISFLKTVHSIGSASDLLKESIELSIQVASIEGRDHIYIPVEVAVSMITILTAQNTVMKGLVEENFQIEEQVQKLIDKLEGKTNG